MSVNSLGLPQGFTFSSFGLSVVNPNSRLLTLMHQYEQCFVHGLKFRFVPSVSKTASGTIHMCPDYDTVDAVPTADNAVVEMAASAFYKSASLCERTTVNMPNLRVPVGYVRPSFFVAPTGTERTTSYGRFIVFVDGYDGSSSELGHIIMEYDLTLILPQPTQPLTLSPTSITRMMSTQSANMFPGDSTSDSTFTVHPVIEVANDGGSAQAQRPNSIFTAIYDSLIGGLGLSDRSETAVADGTRVFFDISTPELDGDGTTNGVKGIFSGLDFAEAGRLFFNCSGVQTMGLKDVKEIFFPSL